MFVTKPQLIYLMLVLNIVESKVNKVFLYLLPGIKKIVDSSFILFNFSFLSFAIKYLLV